MDVKKIINVGAAVATALSTAANDPKNGLSRQDIPSVQTHVETELNHQIEKVDAVVRNVTNQEPWWKSRVIWGLVVTAGMQIARALGQETGSIDEQSVVDWIMQAVSLVGAAYAFYGRVSAKNLKPLGE